MSLKHNGISCFQMRFETYSNNILSTAHILLHMMTWFIAIVITQYKCKSSWLFIHAITVDILELRNACITLRKHALGVCVSLIRRLRNYTIQGQWRMTVPVTDSVILMLSRICAIIAVIILYIQDKLRNA